MSQKLDIKDAAIIRQVLKDAIPKMKTQSTSMGVCYAISSTKNRENYKQMTKNFVCEGLDGNAWVTGWLFTHSKEYKKEQINAQVNDGSYAKFMEKLRQYRIDWIHHMIGKLDAYIKSKGKTSL